MSYLPVEKNETKVSKKQNLLNRIVKMKEFKHLYIKLCSTRDDDWIDTLYNVVNKIDEDSDDDKRLWIVSSCYNEKYSDIKDAALTCINSNFKKLVKQVRLRTGTFKCCIHW